MPEGSEHEDVASLCEGEWELAPQAEALSAWLEENSQNLEPAEYVADIGIGWKRDAASGGAAFSPETLRRMADLGMSLFISEYAGFTDEMTDADRKDSGIV